MNQITEPWYRQTPTYGTVRFLKCSASSLLSKLTLSIRSTCAFPCMQTHTHTHTDQRILELEESYIYWLPLTNWSCTLYVTKALSSHDYGQQIIFKTAQQCSTRTHVLSVTDTTHHNTALCCTFIPVQKDLAHISELSSFEGFSLYFPHKLVNFKLCE